MGDVVRIFDTTLRDGEQSPGFSMNTQEKIRLARQLAFLGVDVIEAGFPIASRGDLEAVRKVAQEVRTVPIAALARARKDDVNAAVEALEPAVSSRLHIFLATSDLHLQVKLNMTREQALEAISSMIRFGRQHVGEVEFSAEDAGRTDIDFLCKVCRVAVDAGATTLNLPDTVGYAVPEEYGAMFTRVREYLGDPQGITLSAHCHDDLGMAVANSLAAVRAGVRQIECTINGIGERAGNAALEEIVMAGRTRPQVLASQCGVNPREIVRTSRLLSHEIGVFPQPNKAIVGRNAFAHEAGIHQHGMLQNGLTYEIISPETVGAGGSSIVLGKHSGRHALERRYRELGYEPDATTLEQLYEAFTALADKKRQILDEDLLTLLHEGFHQAPEVYNLTSLRVTCGTETSTAEVRLAGPGFHERSATATGNGPIAAAFAAVGEALGRTIEVLDLSVQSVTPGRDSLGRVVLQVRIDGKSLSGHGASTDIVEAGARALVHALNKADHADGLETMALSSSYYWGV